MILILILSGCQNKNIKLIKINLPDMPLINQKTVDEIKKLCIPREKCNNINNWLYELYLFKLEYLIYQEELAK